jgi:hypothetical protein
VVQHHIPGGHLDMFHDRNIFLLAERVRQSIDDWKDRVESR